MPYDCDRHHDSERIKVSASGRGPLLASVCGDGRCGGTAPSTRRIFAGECRYGSFDVTSRWRGIARGRCCPARSPGPSRGVLTVDSNVEDTLQSTKSVDNRPDRSQSSTIPVLREVLLRIEAEYREMPGLSLTVSQAERLWRLDTRTCAFVLSTLVDRRILRRTRNGAYLRVAAT